MKKQSLPKLIAKCQIIFNEFVRKRDLSGCSHFKCISCGQIKDERFMNAGHFYNVGHYPGLRFDEDNCHGQCVQCNKFLHGNLIEYRDNLLFKIGAERFEKLKLKADVYKRNGYKFSRFEVEEKIKELQLKVKELY
jgi:gamma-glutamylcyclotransferase (GGCT)/AIG2-like uncharacterized protein YtfP